MAELQTINFSNDSSTQVNLSTYTLKLQTHTLETKTKLILKFSSFVPALPLSTYHTQRKVHSPMHTQKIHGTPS